MLPPSGLPGRIPAIRRKQEACQTPESPLRERSKTRSGPLAFRTTRDVSTTLDMTARCHPEHLGRVSHRCSPLKYGSALRCGLRTRGSSTSSDAHGHRIPADTEGLPTKRSFLVRRARLGSPAAVVGPARYGTRIGLRGGRRRRARALPAARRHRCRRSQPPAATSGVPRRSRDSRRRSPPACSRSSSSARS
jgi:hypothetical protein